MKKLLGMVVHCLLLSGNTYANIILYCKQEFRIITHKGKQKTIPMKENWKLIITNKEIKVPGYEILYKKLIRKKDMEGGTKYYAERGPISGTDGKIMIHDRILISRVDGSGYIKSNHGFGKEENPIKCSNKKPELLF